MKLVLISAIGCLCAFSAEAQSIAGVNLGMTEAAAIAALGGGPTISPMGEGRVLTADHASVAVSTCHGVVTSAQETIGKTVHDFVSEADSMNATMGRPKYRTKTTKLRMGQSSSVMAVWPISGGEWQVEFWQLGNQEAQVYRRISATGFGPCAP